MQVFHRPEKGFNIDETNADGDSALHLCARRGDSQRVELLVMSGSDLALQNSVGNTPLHVVVEESTRQPTTTEAFLEVAFCRTATNVGILSVRPTVRLSRFGIVSKRVAYHHSTFPSSLLNLFAKFRRDDPLRTGVWSDTAGDNRIQQNRI